MPARRSAELDLEPAGGAAAPLAERMRPRELAEVVGQEHVLGEGSPLRLALARGQPPSLVFWGPPGVGKTTLARLIARQADATFATLSAVSAGVRDIRAVIEQAGEALRERPPRRTLLFIDEIHRFSKSQQDALLPAVEDGTLILIGATTENPSFELNGALLSRLRVFVLKPLADAAVRDLLQRALVDAERGLGAAGDAVPADWLDAIARAADGDARRALILLELAHGFLAAGGRVDEAGLERLLGAGLRRFDKGGEQFYDQISAMHKAVRGSDADGALYWYARMLDGGCDPLYVARRLVRMASEDVGLADPRALQLALAAWDAYERLGSPEGELMIAEALVYLAVVPKSNAVYRGLAAARAAVEAHGALEVPLHIRNAPTRLMKELGYGSGYRYDHDEADAHAAGQTYLPPELAGARFYQPTERGLEARIRERLQRLRR